MKNCFYFLILFFVQSAFSAQEIPQKADISYQWLLSKGERLNQNGQFEEAISTYLRLARDYPEKPESYLELAIIYMKKGVNNVSRYYLDLSFKYQNNFEKDEKKVDLYTQEAFFYQNAGDVEKQEFFLKELFKLTEKKLSAAFGKKNHGKAAFLLAVFYLQSDKQKAKLYLLDSLRYEYRRKLSSMFLAAFSREKYEKTRSIEDRNEFLFYYRKYNSFEFEKDSYNLLNKTFHEEREKNDLFYDSIQDMLLNEMF